MRRSFFAAIADHSFAGEAGLFQPRLFENFADQPASEVLLRMRDGDNSWFRCVNKLMVISSDAVQSPSVSFDDLNHLFRGFVFDHPRPLSSEAIVTLSIIGVKKGCMLADREVQSTWRRGSSRAASKTIISFVCMAAE